MCATLRCATTSCAIVRAQLMVRNSLAMAVCPVPSRCTTRRYCGPSRTRCATGSSPSSTPRGSLRAADLARDARHPRQPGQLPPATAGQVRPDRGGPRGGPRQAGPGLAGGRRRAVSTSTIGEIEKAAGRQGGLARSSVSTSAAWGHLVVDTAFADDRAPRASSAPSPSCAVRLTKEEARRAGRGARRAGRALGGRRPGQADDGPHHLPLLRRRSCPTRRRSRAD